VLLKLLESRDPVVTEATADVIHSMADSSSELKGQFIDGGVFDHLIRIL